MKSTFEKDLLFLMAAIALNTSPQLCDSFAIPTTSKTTKMNKITCNMSKDCDRARTERNLEDMMGDDWRVFRAKLIAQEQEEEEEDRTEEISCDLDDNCSEEEKKFNRLGNLFSNAISSIFTPPDKSSSSTSTMEEADHEDLSIFNGNNIGVAGPLEDPFASEEEIVAVCPHHHKHQFDKHRWAHPISHLEPGCVLIANEKLGGVFHQTIFLIIDHNDRTGSTGVCINRPLPGNLLKVSSETNDSLDLSLKLTFNTATVSYGGPVMQGDYSILHGYGEVEGAKKVAPGVFIGGSRELMGEVRRNRFNPKDALFIRGHAAWIPSQLSREVSKGVWYTAAVSPDFILRYAGAPVYEADNAKDLWSDILTAMGGKYEEIAKRYAGRGDARMSYKK